MNLNKPHLWLGRNSTNYIVHILTRLDDLGISTEAGYCNTQSQDDTLFVKLIASTDLPDPGTYISYPLNTDSGYDPMVHERVTVVIETEDGHLLGHATVKPNDGVYSPTTANPSQGTPFLWMRFIDTEHQELHVAVLVPEGSVLEEGTYVDDPNNYCRTINYAITLGSGGGTIIMDDIHYLDVSTGYDPTLDNVIADISTFDASGVKKKKGKGTAHTSEADASFWD